MVPDIDLAWRRGIRPEPPIPVSDWADRHRILPPTSAEPGRWRTDRTPYLRAVMDALSTAIFVMGTEKGLPLARRLEAEAILVTGRLDVYCSRALRGGFSLLSATQNTRVFG